MRLRESVLVIDELGYRADAMVVLTIARRGVRVIAAAHGSVLQDVVENPDLAPLLGVEGSTRVGRPAFGAAVEVRGRGTLWLHSSVTASVDGILGGREPSVVRLPGPAAP